MKNAAPFAGWLFDALGPKYRGNQVIDQFKDESNSFNEELQKTEPAPVNKAAS